MVASLSMGKIRDDAEAIELMTLMTQPQNRIVLFARAPLLGRVKTRLSPALDNDQILALHKRLVHHVIVTATAYGNAVLELWVSEQGEDQNPFFIELSQQFGPFEIHVQQGEDLGARMSYALEQALSRADNVVIIGSDCPALNSHYFDAAFSGLSQRRPVVFGPAYDGGYVLIGSRTAKLPVFSAMPWGTEQVLSLSKQRLDNVGIKYSELSALADIDRPEDIVEAVEYGLWPAL